MGWSWLWATGSPSCWHPQRNCIEWAQSQSPAGWKASQPTGSDRLGEKVSMSLVVRQGAIASHLCTANCLNKSWGRGEPQGSEVGGPEVPDTMSQ